MDRYLQVSEIYDRIASKQTDQEKIDILVANGSNGTLQNVLYHTFAPEISFLIDDVPAYKPYVVPAGEGIMKMQEAMSRVYLFMRNHPKRPHNLEYRKMEILLIQILEAMEHKESEVYINMILREPKVPGLTYELVRQAMPGLLPPKTPTEIQSPGVSIMETF